MHILTVDRLTKIYQDFWLFKRTPAYTAVNAISFHLNKGEILGLLGPNGAGKTTTIQMLLGTLLPSSGTIAYFGKDFVRNRIEALNRIGYVSGYDRLPGQLTVLENLQIVGRMYGLHHEERAKHIEKLLTFFRVWDKRDKPMKSLSAGQATRVMLAKAFLANPEIVLLDEPTASLDPDVAHEVRQFILTQRSERAISVLITSHNMDEVTELCDRVVVLKNGTIIADDTPKKLAQSISKIRLNLRFETEKLKKAQAYCKDKGVAYVMQAQDVLIELEEQEVAHFLADLTRHHVLYSHISIDKPTLEDYFLSVAK